LRLFLVNGNHIDRFAGLNRMRREQAGCHDIDYDSKCIEANGHIFGVRGWGKYTGKIYLHRTGYIAAAQLGITLVSLALGAVGENTFEALLTPLFSGTNLQGTMQRLSPVLAALPLFLSLLIVTSLHVVLGEQVPKVASLHNPERVALAAARPMRAFP
jgi:CBS domain containing-hemolysin-like protein